MKPLRGPKKNNRHRCRCDGRYSDRHQCSLSATELDDASRDKVERAYARETAWNKNHGGVNGAQMRRIAENMNESTGVWRIFDQIVDCVSPPVRPQRIVSINKPVQGQIHLRSD